MTTAADVEAASDREADALRQQPCCLTCKIAGDVAWIYAHVAASVAHVGWLPPGMPS